MTRIVLLTAVLLLTACATPTYVCQSMQGHSGQTYIVCAPYQAPSE